MTSRVIRLRAEDVSAFVNAATRCDFDINDMTLARELWDRLPEDKREAFARIVIRHCAEHCNPILPDGALTILLIDDNGHIYQP